MARTPNVRATVWGLLLIGAMVTLTGSAPIETLNGKIKSIDRAGEPVRGGRARFRGFARYPVAVSTH